jgi:hypothetical protein
MMARGRIFLAVVLILLGALLLLSQLDAVLPDWDVAWPTFLVAGGIALLIHYARTGRRTPGHVFFGTASVLTGTLFFFITLGPLQYDDLASWWPLFLVFGGLAFVAQWTVTGFRDRRAAFLALVALILGGAELATRLQWPGPDTSLWVPSLGAALLIVAGLVLLVRVLFRRRR